MHATFLSCENKGRALWWMLARIAGWNTNDCDYNKDGFVDQKDLVERRRDVFEEWQSWIKKKWDLKQKGADFDGNGVIDLKDRLEKFQSLFKELVIWMRDCRFSDKRNSKSLEPLRDTQRDIRKNG